MKTPRETLLNRHRAKLSQLDAIREQVVATELRSAASSETAEGGFALRLLLAIWNELIFPARRAWAGFAVVWFLIITVNVMESVHTRNQWLQAKGEASELLAVWRQQQRLAQLSDQAASITEPQAAKPRSRSANPPHQKAI